MPNKATQKRKMNKKDKEYYRKLLLDLKEKIQDDIKNLSGNGSDSKEGESRDISGHALHMADVATDMYDREFSLGLASSEREILQKIEESLQRLEEGTYGTCTITGKPISKARLKAIPYAETCLQAQEELESKK